MAGELPKSNTEPELRLASPADRLAAVIVDILLFTPIIAVVIAPLRRYALEANLLGNRVAQMHAVWGAAFIAVCVFVVARAISHAVWGATVGQRVLSVKVVSVWTGERPSFQAAGLRALLWCTDVLMIAPLSALFSDARRRTFHDRAADTVVLSLKPERAIGAPSAAEAAMANGFQNAVWCVTVAAVVSAAGGKIFSPLLKVSDKLAKNLEADGELCHEVGEAHADGPKTNTRLQTALNLYAAEKLDESCLASEADFALWNETQKPLAYLAKAVLEEPSSALRETYFAKACDQADVCDAVDFVRAMTDGDAADFDTPLAKLGEAAPAFVKISAIPKLIDRGEVDRALVLMSEIAPEKKIGLFLARERARALWLNNDTAAARTTFSATVPLMAANERVDFARWLCGQEIATGGCPETGRVSCDLLRNSIKETPSLLATSGLSATFVRADSCYGNDLGLAMKLSSSIPEKSGRVVLDAFTKLRDGDDDAAFASLAKVARGAKEDPFYLMANIKLVEIANSAEELEPIEARWLKLKDSDSARRGLGMVLSERYASFGQREKSLDTLRSLANLEQPDAVIYRKIVLSAYHAGHFQLAREFMMRLEPAGRAPAASDEYSQILRELKGSP